MSKITIKNYVDQELPVVIFRKPAVDPSLQAVAWKVVVVGVGGKHPGTGELIPGIAITSIPGQYSVYASYPVDSSGPYGGYQTAALSFEGTTARFIIAGESAQPDAALLTRSWEDTVENVLRVENQFKIGVWVHVTKDGHQVRKPQVVATGEILTEDVQMPFYAAIAFQLEPGDVLDPDKFSSKATEVMEGGTLVITENEVGVRTITAYQSEDS